MVGTQFNGRTFYSISEIEESSSLDQIDRSLKVAVEWIRAQIASPGPGNREAFCPWATSMVIQDQLLLANLPTPTEKTLRAAVRSVVSAFNELFMMRERDMTHPVDSVIRVAGIVPLAATPEEGARLVDWVQAQLKTECLERGFYLGHFHAERKRVSIRFPPAQPMRSPVPMVLVRHLVPGDARLIESSEKSAMVEEHLGILRRSLEPRGRS